VSFAEPRLLALLAAAPLAGLAAAWLLAARARADAAWTGRTLAARLRAGGPPRPAGRTALLLALAVAALALALSRPRWGVSERQVERRGIDVVFVLDSSLSMVAADVPPSRFWLAQSLVRRMAEAMPGNRVGLVAAEGVGVVLSPLTTDTAVIDLLLDASEPATLPVPGSRLVDALARAAALFPEGSETHRAIVLLSDGELHGEPLGGAVEQLAEAGVTLHAIGIGTPSGAPLPLGRDGQVKRDRQGQVVISRLDLAPLEELAGETGGLVLAAAGPEADPAPILAALAAMPGRLHDSRQLESHAERFQWPLALAAAALAASLAGGPWAPRRRERREVAA